MKKKGKRSRPGSELRDPIARECARIAYLRKVHNTLGAARAAFQRVARGAGMFCLEAELAMSQLFDLQNEWECVSRGEF